MSNKREVHDFVVENHDAIRELADNLYRQSQRGGYRGQMVTIYDDPSYYVEFAAVKLYVEKITTHNTQSTKG